MNVVSYTIFTGKQKNDWLKHFLCVEYIVGFERQYQYLLLFNMLLVNVSDVYSESWKGFEFN